MDRLTYYMEVAQLTAKRGTCSRLLVGCVLVDENTNRIVSIGYNSSHKGTPHCTEKGCLLFNDHCVRTLHAEQAAIVNLEHQYEKLICYLTHSPCINCFKLLAAVNVKTIYYDEYYDDPPRDDLNLIIKIPIIKLNWFKPSSFSIVWAID